MLTRTITYRSSKFTGTECWLAKRLLRIFKEKSKDKKLLSLSGDDWRVTVTDADIPVVTFNDKADIYVEADVGYKPYIYRHMSGITHKATGDSINVPPAIRINGIDNLLSRHYEVHPTIPV